MPRPTVKDIAKTANVSLAQTRSIFLTRGRLVQYLPTLRHGFVQETTC